MTWLANSKHTSIRSCRRWKSRSPGVETARCTVPASSRNGCSSAGRGPENSRSHAAEPIPATQASGASGTRNPTDRCSPAQSASRSLTASSPPGSMISTMKIAAAVSGASTGCGSGSGSGRATAGTCDHSVTKRPFPGDTKLPRGKVSRAPSRKRRRAGGSAASSMLGRVSSSSRKFVSSRCARTAPMVPKPIGGSSLDWALMTIEPPEAKKIPSPRTFHGDTVVDEYAWLADKDDADTIGYLRAENAYTDALTAHLAPLREQIFEEIKARTQESDLSVPVRKGGWWHYSRTVEGKQYAVYCRRAVRPGEVIPPIPADGKPLDGEEELLDGNELAVGHEFFSLGAFRTSPDQRWLAYSTDFSGNERFTIRIKDLA